MKKFRKIIPFILVLVILLPGLFGSAQNVEAQAPGICTTVYTPLGGGGTTNKITVQADCPPPSVGDLVVASQIWTPSGGGSSTVVGTNQAPAKQSIIEKKLETCNPVEWGPGTLLGCVAHITYFLFVTIPSFLMGLVAKLFNFVAILTLSKTMYDQAFIGTIWAVVRDFANIFFILVLLYAAVKIILDLGHGDGKKIVASVILIALVVNFSLFFTKIIIDSSNIAALIFYNRIDTTTTPSIPTSTLGEKDLAGALVSKFNINTFFSGELFDKMEKDPVVVLAGGVNQYLLIAMMVSYGLVIYTLTYAFFMAAMALFGRMLMLMMLMIISPFAFITKAIPKLSGKNTIGFDSWLSKLLETSFVAAIFMFIIYIIAQILDAKVFDSVADSTNKGTFAILVVLFVPAMLIILLLLKGVKFAKQASGEFTGAVISGVQKATGLVGGAVLGGAAVLGTGVVGGLASKTMKGEAGEVLREQQDKGGWRGFGARMALKGLNYGTKSTFDVRKTGLGGTLARTAGIDLQSASVIGLGSREGGFKGIEERKKKMVLEESELYKTNLSNEEIQRQSAARLAEWEAGGRVGPEPKQYSSVDALNAARMATFQKNIGKTGFLHNLAQSSVEAATYVGALKTITDADLAEAKAKYATESVAYKTRHAEPTKESMREERIGYAKLIIGGGAAVATGGYAGAAVGSAVGLAGGAMGMAIPGASALGGGIAGGLAGGGAAFGTHATDEGAWSKARAGMEKEKQKLQDVEKRLADMKEVLTKQTDVLVKGTALPGNIVTERPGVMDLDKPVFDINTENLEAALIRETSEAEDLKDQLSVLNQKIIREHGGTPTPEDLLLKGDIQARRNDHIKNVNQLNDIKNTGNAISNTKTQIYNLSGQKSSIKDTSGKGGTPPPSPAATSPGH